MKLSRIARNRISDATELLRNFVSYCSIVSKCRLSRIRSNRPSLIRMGRSGGNTILVRFRVSPRIRQINVTIEASWSVLLVSESIDRQTG